MLAVYRESRKATTSAVPTCFDKISDIAVVGTRVGESFGAEFAHCRTDYGRPMGQEHAGDPRVLVMRRGVAKVGAGGAILRCVCRDRRPLRAISRIWRSPRSVRSPEAWPQFFRPIRSSRAECVASCICSTRRFCLIICATVPWLSQSPEKPRRFRGLRTCAVPHSHCMLIPLKAKRRPQRAASFLENIQLRREKRLHAFFQPHGRDRPRSRRALHQTVHP